MNNSSTVLKEMQSLPNPSTQNFTYTKEQQERYDELLELLKHLSTSGKKKVVCG